MNAPEKISAAVQRLSADLAAGRTTRIAAIESLRKIIEQDRGYARGILSVHAGRLLAAWRRVHPPAVDSLQAELFPALPAVLYVRPGEAISPMECTRYGLEMARNMLYARTSNHISGATEAARREREAIDGLCDLVMPRMGADPRMTVAQALDEIRRSGEETA